MFNLHYLVIYYHNSGKYIRHLNEVIYYDLILTIVHCKATHNLQQN